ncbi:SRPBCC domain-containing protein [Kineococcus sp. SYSU DK003]|uniref:SRPBCC domain-containing protein n=1 Tax=Kineococcus sp. SYSU DK003 TaxID=3383124 RepID=UPI003D7EE976
MNLVPTRVHAGTDGRWTLVFEREFTHPPQAVWSALTVPEEVVRWTPYLPQRNLASTGEAQLRMTDEPDGGLLDATVEVVEENRVLQHRWGEDVLRWELHPTDAGTRLVLHHTTKDFPDLSKFAAGWHVCTDTLATVLDGDPRPVAVGEDAEDHGWVELEAAYRELLPR